MTPDEREAYEARRVESAKNVAEAKAIFARREQRLREWDEHVARRRACLRSDSSVAELREGRPTGGLLGMRFCSARAWNRSSPTPVATT